MKTYQITFKAELSEDDVKAMNKYFYDTMNESMQISTIWDLKLTEIKKPDIPNTFDNIQEIEHALRLCKNITEVNKLLDNIPRKFGEWWVDTVLVDALGYYCYEVTNQWWDDYAESFYTDSYLLDIPVEEEV